MSNKTTILAAIIIVGIATHAIAHGGATGIVKQRMEAMSSMAKAMKSMAAMVKRSVTYNADAMKKGAEVLAIHAGTNMTKLFPADVKQKASEARVEIWQDWDEFLRLAKQLEHLANGLAMASENGLSEAGSAQPIEFPKDGSMPQTATLASMPADLVFRLVGKSCSSCHEKFRLKKH